MRPGAFANTSFDFTAPRKQLLAICSSPKPHQQAAFEVFDYPGDYSEPADSEVYARRRLEEVQAAYALARARGNVRALTSGALFYLIGHRREDQNREYLVLGADYRLRSDEFGSDTETPTMPVFRSTLTVIDAQLPYRPPRQTPKAVVRGPQTAIVVGTAGEEIWTDQYGRVKVQFHWDRYGKQDENSSCWVRVSQPWAGKGWGAVAIPRIGQEVVVSFLEGDPDRPLITGRVYNGNCMPPYDLPGSAVISGLKSNSTKGGAGYNEYVMDDTKGNELIREHGQYDKDSTIQHDLREQVLHDRTREVSNNEQVQVGNDRRKEIGHDEVTEVGNDRSETVGNNETISIGNDRKERVGCNEDIGIGANRTDQVGGDESITIGKGRTEQVGKSESVQINDDRSHSIGSNDRHSVGKNLSQTVGEQRSAAVGKDDSLTVGKTLRINAGDAISITTGSASITMKKDGTIVIKGKDISIQGSGKINAKASGNVTIKGSKVLQN